VFSEFTDKTYGYGDLTDAAIGTNIYLSSINKNKELKPSANMKTPKQYAFDYGYQSIENNIDNPTKDEKLKTLIEQFNIPIGSSIHLFSEWNEGRALAQEHVDLNKYNTNKNNIQPIERKQKYMIHNNKIIGVDIISDLMVGNELNYVVVNKMENTRMAAKPSELFNTKEEARSFAIKNKINVLN